VAGRSVINVLVNADPRKFKAGMAEAEGALGKLGGAAKGAAKLVAAAGAAMGVAATAFAVKSIQAGEAAATANARLEQIATSMGLFGDQASTVAYGLREFAEEQARLTGVNQNTIKESQALLLTFKELAVSADEYGGAFDRATKLTIDMAAAGFGSATDNAKQLGKALNDPIKGLTALSRSGIQFTEDQKSLIKSLVESGQMLEAQNIVLTEIEAQVGGTAEATANASDKMRVGISQVSETVGLLLLPYFNQLVDFILAKVLPAFEMFAVETVFKIEEGVKRMRAALGLLRDRYEEVRVAADDMAASVRDQVSVELERGKKFVEDYNDELAVAAGAIGGIVAALITYQTATAAARGATLLFTAANLALNFVLALNPILLIIITIGALVGALIVAYQRFESVREVVDRVWAAIQTAAEVVWEFVQTAWAALLTAFESIQPAIDLVVDLFFAVRDAISTAISDAVDAIKENLGPLAGWFNDNVVATLESAITFLITLFQRIAEFVAPILEFIITALADFVATATNIILGFVDYIRPVFEIFWDAMKMIVIVAFEAIENAIEIALAVIRGIFDVGTALLKGDFSGVWEALKGIVTDSLSAIGDFIGTFFDETLDFLRGLPDKIGRATLGMWDGIKNAFKEAINFIIRGWNRLEFRVPGFSIGPIGYDGFTLGVPDIPLLADGGIVNRATLAVIGEAGPEAVVPLDQIRGGGLGGPTYNITVQAGVGDPGMIGQSVVDAITAYERRNGAGWRAA
jgi:phage-related protein